MEMVSFDVSREDSEIIDGIVRRAGNMADNMGIECDRLMLAMDITTAHANGCPLRLQELLEAREGDFGHDVFGIRQYLNRETGRLEHGFSPRYAVRQ